MSRVVYTLSSFSAFEAHCKHWDELWRRCESTNFLAQAQFLKPWYEVFGAASPFKILLVYEGGNMVLGVALLEKRRGFFKVGEMFENDWCEVGEVLIDPSYNRNMLPTDLARTGFSVCRLKGIDNANEPRSLAYQTGYLEIPNDYQAWVKQLPKNLRKNLNRRSRKLEEHAPLSLRVWHSGDDFTSVLAECLALELAGWKGREGGAIGSDKKIRFYLEDLFINLAKLKVLRIFQLRLGNDLVAYEIGWVFADRYFSYKIGFDENFKEYSPGQILLARIVEHFVAESGVSKFDTMGEASETFKFWNPRLQQIDYSWIAPGLLIQRLLRLKFSSKR